MYMIKKYFQMVNEGYRFCDRLILAILLPISKLFKIQNKKTKIIVKNKDGVFYCESLDHFFMYSPNREKELRPYFKLSKGKIFIDIGANIGKYSILIANKNNSAKIIAIEPSKEATSLFKKNVEINNLKNIEILEKLLFSKRKRIKFYLNPEKTTRNSILKNEVLRDKKYKSKKNIISYHWMETETLDNLLSNQKREKVELLKIDVQGAELDVLKGAIKILKKDEPKIIFEAWNEDYLKKLSLI
jgi:FkbM family methyltransferase